LRKNNGRRVMVNSENITEYNFKNLTPDEQREIASKGGKASGEARRTKKTLKEIGDMIGALAIKSDRNRAIMKQAGITDENMINDVGMMFRLNLKAQQGDTKAIELLSKLRGQFKEVQSVEVAEVKPLVDLTKRKKNGNSKDDQSN
jgi:hypothetical protein